MHALTLSVILFITTPTAILSTIQKIDVFGVFSFTWVESIPFLKNNLPPLVILGINQIILLLIDLSSLAERHETHSLY